MSNPWQKLKLEHYEGHMQHEEVLQSQCLNLIMKNQLNDYDVKSICILGISGGNGLEHVEPNSVLEIFGVDINKEYLLACKLRYPKLNGILNLIHADITSSEFKVPDSEIIIANLIIEYLGIDTFKKIIYKSNSAYISCVIQVSNNYSFVSNTPFINYFNGISRLHNDIDKNVLINVLKVMGYDAVFHEEFKMKNNKSLIRIDFKNKHL